MSEKIKRNILLYFIIWLTLNLLSVIVPLFIEPIGDGFTRGLNRIIPSIFMQIFALLFALISAVKSIKRKALLNKNNFMLGIIPSIVSASLYFILIIYIAIQTGK